MINKNDPPTIAAGQIFTPNENVNTAEVGCTYTADPCVCLLRCPTGMQRYGDGSACRKISDPNNDLLKCDLGHCHGNPNGLYQKCIQGGAVGTVSANDPDGDSLSFTATTESGCPFEVGTTDGVIHVVGLVNYESRRDWTLKVTAVDPSGSSSGVVDVLMQIQNMNDPPLFDGGNVVEIREDCSASSTASGCTHQVSSLDEDDLGSGSGSMGSPLSYTVVTNTCGMDITSSGLIQSSSSSHDYETKPTCNVDFKVSDSGGAFTTRQFVINFLDVNENPTFTTPMAQCVVPEDFNPQNTLPDPCVLSATDPDTGVSQTLSFSASAVGDVTVENSRVLILQSLDFEVTNTYTITVQVTDDGPTGNQLGSFGSTSGTQTVQVTDVNEPPIFTSGLIFTVQENTAAGTRFYIKKNRIWTININSQTLQLTEGMTVSQVGNAAVGSIASSISGTTNTFSVVSEVSQTFTSNQNLVIDESGINEIIPGSAITSATYVLQPSSDEGLSATDPETSTLTYTLRGTSSIFDGKNNVYDYFAIDSISNPSLITFKVDGSTPVDFEQIANRDGTLEVHVTVTDDGSTRDAAGISVPGSTNLADETGVVAVFVADVNEPPTLVQKPNGIKVGSATSPGSVVSIFDWRDPDADDTVQFYKTNIWTITLTSSVNVGTITKGLTVTQVGNNAVGALGLSVIGSTTSILIHSASDQTFVSSSDIVIDPNGINKIIESTSIQSVTSAFAGWDDGSGNDYYSLSAATGEIILQHDVSGQGGTSKTITAYAQDAAGMKSSYISFIVTIVSENTAPTMSPQTIDVSEGVAINSTVGPLLSTYVTDPQVTTVCDPTAVRRPNDGLAGAGQLCTALSTVDCETTNPTTNVQTCALTLSGTSCTCRQQSLKFSLEKLSPLASELADTQSELVDYPFKITENGAIQVVSQLDYETIPGTMSGLQSKYTLTIKIDDTGTGDGATSGTYKNSLSTVSTMTITITDVQEKPYFDFFKKIIDVREDAYTNGNDFIIDTKIYATDPDLTEWFDGKITFAQPDHSADPNHVHPNGVDPASLFKFVGGPPNNVQGAGNWDANAEAHWTKLKLVAPLNYEFMNIYTLEIIAKDTVHSLVSEEVDIVIQVLDVNESPTFNVSSTTFNVNENQPAGSIIGLVGATDDDIGDTSVQFTLTSGSSNGEFSIGQLGMSMNLKVGNNGLDFETKRSYTLVVTAEDSGGLSATSTIIVNVNDVDDVEITSVKIGANGLSTSGGEILSIFGTNFGLKDGTSTNVVVTYFRRGTTSTVTPFTTTGCQVVVLNTMINCTTTSDGYGTDLVVKVVISGTANGQATSSNDATVRFQPPSITSVGTVNSLPMPTEGSSTLNVILTGVNFGPLNLNWKAEYGITSAAGYCAVGCKVTVAHTQISCQSVQGVGSSMQWRVLLPQEGEGKAPYESLPSNGFTSYAPSTITSISSSSIDGNLDTKGGDSLTIVGTNFGSLSHSLTHCDGTAVTTGNQAQPAPLPLPPIVRYGTLSNPSKYKATECSVVVDHTKILCKKTSAGVGKGLKVRVDMGYLNNMVEGDVSSNGVDVSYKKPTVRTVGGSGAMASLTIGGDVFEIEGSGFGPVGEAKSVRVLYQQSSYTASRTDRPALPVFEAIDCRVLTDNSMTCKTGVGVGYNFTYKVEIEGQLSDTANNAVRSTKALKREPSHNGGAYARPTVNTVTKRDMDPLYDADTRGGELVVIRGTNFGPIATWNIVTATFGLPSLSPGSSVQQFTAQSCNVTESHTEITCYTAQGAGTKHQWKVHIAGLTSVLSETSYGKPIIHSISASNSQGNAISTQSLTSNGGDKIKLHGLNFGPAVKSSDYLISVTYGVTGVEYNCIQPKVLSHSLIECTTSEGTGKNLIFNVNVLNQIGASAVYVNYAPPNILSISKSADTIELNSNFRIYMNCTNGGIGVKNGNTQTILWDDVQKEILPDLMSSRRLNTGINIISFSLPELIGRDGVRSYNIPIRVRVTEVDGTSQTSLPIMWSYEPPYIEQVHVTSGDKSSQRRLTLVGKNFGRPSSEKFPVGAVLLTEGDGGSECNNFPCEIPLLTTTSMYVEKWTHRAITVVYTGTRGALQVRTSRVSGGMLSSNIQNFSNTSPTVLQLSSDQGNKLLYNTLGYSSSRGGTLSIICQFCDQVFLSVIIGEYRTGNMDGRSPQEIRNCPIVGTPEYPLELTIHGEKIPQLTRIVCQVPPGMGTNVSVVVVRAGSRSLEKYQLNYIKPSVTRTSEEKVPTKGKNIMIYGNNFGDENAATCYLDDKPLATKTIGTSRSQLECMIPPGIGSTPRDIWVRVAGQDSCRKSITNSNCLGNALTIQYLPPKITDVQLPPAENRSTEGGFEITLVGDNFATAGVGSNVTIAGTNCMVTRTSFNEIKCIVQEAVGEDLGIQVSVGNQISGPSAAAGGSGSLSLPELSYTKPEIFSISPTIIPTNATRSDGTDYTIEVIGRNFGTKLLSKGFRIYVGEKGSNNVAIIEQGSEILIHEHRRIVFKAPKGQGKKLQIILEVGPTAAKAQNSTDFIYLSYEPPTIKNTFTLTGPTDGCSDRLGWEPLVTWATR